MISLMATTVPCITLNYIVRQCANTFTIGSGDLKSSWTRSCRGGWGFGGQRGEWGVNGEDKEEGASFTRSWSPWNYFIEEVNEICSSVEEKGCDIPWDILRSVEISWDPMRSLEIPWDLLICLEILWDLSRPHEIPWNPVWSLDISWDLMKSLEIPWDLLRSHDICKNVDNLDNQAIVDKKLIKLIKIYNSC